MGGTTRLTGRFPRYPLQIVALARGAHGARIAGIAGDTTLGAYSIVASSRGAYEGLDRDEGDRLFYSGSRSHENEDPDRPAPRPSRPPSPAAAPFASSGPVVAPETTAGLPTAASATMASTAS